MEQALALRRMAVSGLGGVSAQQAGRLVLSLFFKAVLGIQRIFHFDSLTDVGLALLTGGERVLPRRALGALVRAVSTRSVHAFVRLTQPVVKASEPLWLSNMDAAVDQGAGGAPWA